MVKKLIICPKCEENGVKNILGELDDNGDFIILRFSHQKTKLRGSVFEVICDKCGEKVFYRNGK